MKGTNGVPMGLPPGQGAHLRTFVEMFDLLADADGGIEKLRALVLDLAVRGRAVRPDMALPPATEAGLVVSDAEHKSPHVSEDDDLLRNVTLPAPNWLRTKLGNVVEFAYGKSLPKKSRNDLGVVPAYGSNGAVGVHDEALVDQPCLVVGRKGSSGAVNLVPVPSWPIDTTYYVLAPKGLHLPFLFILLRALRLDRFDRSTAIPGLNRADAYALTALIPPLAQQGRIVAKVDELMRLLDDLEARQAKRRETQTRLRTAALEALASADGPTDFEAAWSRVAENFGVLFERAESISDLRTSVLGFGLKGWLTRRGSDVAADSPPSGWWRGTVGDLATFVTSGSRNWKNYYALTGATFVRSTDIKTDALDLSAPAFVTVPDDVEGTRTRVTRDDILITITGANVGKAAHVNRDVPEAYVSQHVALVRLRDTSEARWVHRWLVSPWNGRGQLLASSYGDKPGLNLNQVKSVVIDLPPPGERETILELVESKLRLCDDLEAKLHRAETTAVKLAEAVVAEMVGA